jgi:amidase
VPYLLKDSLDYPGMPTVAGSRSRRGVLAHAASRSPDGSTGMD